MTERKRGEGKSNTSQSVPCGALLVRCCHLRCLGGHRGREDPGGRGTGHRSLASLKSISWQLAEGKAAIRNHQAPARLAHIFLKPSPDLLPYIFSPSSERGRNPAALMHGATLSAGAGKVRPHLGDFLSDPGKPPSRSKHATPTALSPVLSTVPPCLFLRHTKFT